MAEATMETPSPTDVAALEEAARAFDVARMKRIGSYHFALVMGALTLWGAAEAWAQSTGWAIAQFAAVANALIAGYVIPSTIHEWGHFLGARLSGAASPVLNEPKGHFFMFDFKMDENTTEQFTWMSWGGIVAPWIPVLVVAIFVPLSLTSGAVLFATLLSKAVGVAVFEGPVALAAAQSGEPGRALNEAVVGGGLDRGRRVGNAVGIAAFLLLWIVA